MNFRFAQPLAFLLLLPLAFAAWRLLRRSGSFPCIPFAALGRIARRRESWRTIAAKAAPYGFLAGMLLAVIAAARPQSYTETVRRKDNGVAIAMVVDVSGSMAALDLADNPLAKDAPRRIDVVKEEFASFIKARSGDLVSLTVFGGYATPLCPLTHDHDALLAFLGNVELPGQDPDDVTTGKEESLTAIGDGLASACARLRDAPFKSKVIVLLSDGVSNAGILSTEKAAGIAKKLGIKVYTIGVGSKGGAETLFRQETPRGAALLPGVVEFDEKELVSIANATGGKYYLVGDRKGLENVMAEIDSLEKTETERDVFVSYREKFFPFAISAALVASLSYFMAIASLHRPL